MFQTVALFVSRSNGVSKQELRKFIETDKQIKQMGEWKDGEIDELFIFLNGDVDGSIPLLDFFQATVLPLLQEQVRRTVKAEDVGKFIADQLPLPEFLDKDGVLQDPFTKMCELNLKHLIEVFMKIAPEVCMCPLHQRSAPARL